MDRLAGGEKQEGPPLPGVSNTPAGSGDGGEEAGDHCLRTKLGFKNRLSGTPTCVNTMVNRKTSGRGSHHQEQLFL